jgi:hypothetical protein
MAIPYIYVPGNGILVTRPSGKVTMTDLIELIEALLKDTSLDTPFVKVLDFSHLDNLLISDSLLDQVVRLLERLKKEKEYMGMILVADSDYTHSMAQMFKSKFEDRGVSLGIARNMDEGLQMAKNVKTFKGLKE